MVSGVRKLCILTVCLILALVIMGCAGQKSETSTPTPKSTENRSSTIKTPTLNTSASNYDIEWGLEYGEIKEPKYHQYVELKVKIVAKRGSTDMYILVSDPDGKTIGRKFIPKEDLYDGLEFVKFQMGDYERTPKPGNYTAVLVSYPSRELLYKETRTFNVANLSVSVGVKTHHGKYMYAFWDNTGDLPIFVQYASIEIKNLVSPEIVYLWENKAPPAGSDAPIVLSPPNEKYTMPGGNRFIMQVPLDNLKEGTYGVLILLHYPIGEKGFADIQYDCILKVYENGNIELSQPHYHIDREE